MMSCALRVARARANISPFVFIFVGLSKVSQLGGGWDQHDPVAADALETAVFSQPFRPKAQPPFSFPDQLLRSRTTSVAFHCLAAVATSLGFFG